MEQNEQAANYNPATENIMTKFSFKKRTIEDKETGLKTEINRPAIEVSLPLITVQGIVNALQAGDKQLELVLEACRQIQLSRAREIINDDESITADNFPVNELVWNTIANMPKSERRGGGIDKEVWEAFGADYALVMPAATGKTEEQIANAVKIILAKFVSIKNSKPHLKFFKEQLAVYLSASTSAEQFVDCVEFLVGRADKYLKLDDIANLNNL